jgi:hypothetical protein
MWSMWPSYQRPLLSSKISRNKKSEKERCTFSGIKDSAHFSSHEKRSYHTFAYTGKHLADYSHKISIISRQSKLIPKELRYQEKIHDTCNYLICQEKYPANSPQNIFFLLKRIQYRKQSLDLLFLSSPTSTCKILSREIGGKTQLVPRLQDKHSNLMS